MNGLLTSPTALRAIVREDPEAEFMTKYDLTKYAKPHVERIHQSGIEMLIQFQRNHAPERHRQLYIVTILHLDTRMQFTYISNAHQIKQKKRRPTLSMSLTFVPFRLRAVFPAGEHFDPNTAKFLARHLHHPVLDHYWQTESGWPMVANPTGMKVCAYRWFGGVEIRNYFLK